MAANFAIANRICISRAVKEAFREVFKDVSFEDIYEISHNLVQKEGDYFIHRKGATRAFTGKQMRLTSPWKDTGHPIIIPGSMASGAAVLYATDGAEESFYSINHGAGRVLGRNEAKRTLNQEEVNKWMADIIQTFDGVEVKSILVNDRNVPLDESGDCYKGLDDILEAVEMAGLAKVALRLYPIAVIKGND
jgi:tRNA-splicing ligase RtcB